MCNSIFLSMFNCSNRTREPYTKYKMELKVRTKRKETEIKGCLHLSSTTTSIIPHAITLLAIELLTLLPLLNAVERIPITLTLPFQEHNLQTSEESVHYLLKHKQKGWLCQWFSTSGKRMCAHHRWNREIPHQTCKIKALLFPFRFAPLGLQCG